MTAAPNPEMPTMIPLPKMPMTLFHGFDTDGNGELVVPEYLRVWGRWARSAKGH